MARPSERQHLLDHEEGADVLTQTRLRRPAAQITGGRPAGGFTLIELITTITLIGILVALGLPSLSTWIRNSQVRTVADTLQTGLRTAQAEAVRRNRVVVLSFTNSTPALNATAVAGGKNWSLQTIPQFGESSEFVGGGALAGIASGVAITSTPSSSAICFNSNGRLVAPTGTGCTAAVATLNVTQTNADRPLRIIVQIGGQVRMCDPHRPTLSASTPDGCPP